MPLQALEQARAFAGQTEPFLLEQPLVRGLGVQRRNVSGQWATVSCAGMAKELLESVWSSPGPIPASQAARVVPEGPALSARCSASRGDGEGSGDPDEARPGLGGLAFSLTWLGPGLGLGLGSGSGSEGQG